MKEINIFSTGKNILIALIFGVLCGLVIHNFASSNIINNITYTFSLISNCFIRLIKMIIAPLIFTSLAFGVYRFRDIAKIKNIFISTMLFFIVTSIFSLGLGIILVNYFEPGHTLSVLKNSIDNLLNHGHSSTMLDAVINKNNTPSIKNFIEHTIPNSMIKPFVENDIIAIVIIALITGFAGISLGDKALGFFNILEQFNKIIFKITGYIMTLAPLAVFSSLVVVISQHGVSLLSSYGIYILQFYFGLLILWIVLFLVMWLVIGKKVIFIIKELSSLFGIAFVLSSSEAVYPALQEKLINLGIKQQICELVLPLGYSFNLMASMMNCTFATIFITQIYGYDLGIGQQIMIMLTIFLTSKGIAGVPRASLVVVAATLSMFGYPEAGILLLLPIDVFLDMGRSATNVFAECMATFVINKWKGQ